MSDIEMRGKKKEKLKARQSAVRAAVFEPGGRLVAT